MDELFADFVTEAQTALADADRGLEQLSRVPQDGDVLASVHRSFHTIKGNALFLPLPRLARLARAAEDELASVQDGSSIMGPVLLTRLVAASERLRLILGGVSVAGVERAGDDSRLIAALAAPVPAPAATVAVSAPLLETLIALADRLVTIHSQLIPIVPPDSAYAVGLQRLGQVTADLHAGLMKTRMQPLGLLQEPLARLIRGLSQDLGKPIRFTTAGLETALDRPLLDPLRETLLLLLRHSAEHGLEAVPSRLGAGKTAAGHIALTAAHQGDHVVVELTDDGAGLDAAQRAAAMASVADGIARLQGTLVVDSTPGRGSRYTLTLPLTMTCIAGQIFHLPQAAVIDRLAPRRA